jgi:hypothetical protein
MGLKTSPSVKAGLGQLRVAVETPATRFYLALKRLHPADSSAKRSIVIETKKMV